MRWRAGQKKADGAWERRVCGRGIHASLGHVAISDSVCLRLDPAHTRAPPALARVCAAQRSITSCGKALHPEPAPLAPGTLRLALLKQDKCDAPRAVFLHPCSPAFALLTFSSSPRLLPPPVFALSPRSACLANSALSPWSRQSHVLWFVDTSRSRVSLPLCSRY